jgi:hypothetical protein
MIDIIWNSYRLWIHRRFKIMGYEFLCTKKDNSFFSVALDEINVVEKELELVLPQDLKDLYLTVGYGFIKGWEYNVNRIMHPYSVRDFRKRQNDFEFFPDIDIYDEVEHNTLIFFEANESALMSIGIDDDNYGAIFSYYVKIAENLKEFLIKLQENDRYYIELV